MPKPILHIFPISHYCEKARWALDYLHVDYDLNHIPVGTHRKLAQKLGAPFSSVPILVADEQVVQGSSAIIDWADANAATDSTYLTPKTNREENRKLEQRLDDAAGVHIRRYFYSEAVVDHPQKVLPMFTMDLPLHQKLMVRLAWGKVQSLMIKFMDLGPEQGGESKAVVEAELDWVDSLLSDGRQFLGSDRFSRVDITAASLLSPLAAPAEHPTYTVDLYPPGVARDMEEWSSRPSINWVREMYARYRQVTVDKDKA